MDTSAPLSPTPAARVAAIPAEYAGSRRTAPDGTPFRDLDGDGVMSPYEDPRRSPEERTADLLGRLSPREKAGLVFQEILPGAVPDVDDAQEGSGAHRLLVDLLVNHVNVHDTGRPQDAARRHNRLQLLAEASPHGIPLTVSSDPRHGFRENVGASFRAQHGSAWPEPLGLAALGDPDRVREFAGYARREYLAVGIRAALHPTVDLATAAGWARQYGTFGQDPTLAGDLARAYLDGFEGTELGPDSVACTTKHFPGGGPQQDGEDPHFPYGREQVYPGGRFEDHLAPFRAVLARGTAGIMPYYGMPVGLVRDGEAVEEVGFGFNRQVVTGLLRGELGYDGVVCTDWGLVTDTEVAGRPLPARAWGVEHLSALDRVAKVLDAGCDQFGGESCPDLVLELLATGRLTRERLDDSVRRLLLVKFRLGLFDDPFVDEAAAQALSAHPEAVAAGRLAQSESLVRLVGDGALPTLTATRWYVEGLDPAAVPDGVAVVATPAEADVAVLRREAPFDPRDDYFLEAAFHAGTLEFSPDQVERVATVAREVPVVLVVTLDRPAVLTPLLPHCTALLGAFGVSDEALVDVLTGTLTARGRLPFDLPRSEAAVRAARPDVAGDTPDALFRAGDGFVEPLPG